MTSLRAQTKNKKILLSLALLAIVGLPIWAFLKIHNNLMIIRKLQIGKKLPELELRSLEGKQVRISELLGGGSLILMFIDTRCERCKKELAVLKELNKMSDNKVKVLVITKNSADETRRFMKEHGLTFKFFSGKEAAFGDKLGIKYVPALIIVDEDGLAKHVLK